MRRNWLEWAILVASVVAIVVLAGYLGIEAVAPDGPPEISVVPQRASGRETTLGWEMPVVVRNGGGSPAVAVTIEATASVAGKPETSELVVDLVAPGSEVELVAGFSAAPDGDVAFRLVGYEAP